MTVGCKYYIKTYISSQKYTLNNFKIPFTSRKIQDLRERNSYRIDWAIKNNLKIPGIRKNLRNYLSSDN